MRRFHPRFTELSAMSLALGIMVTLSILSNSNQLIDTNYLPSTSRVLNSKSERTIRVEGYGDRAPEGSGDALQSAQGVDQSGDVDQSLQNPKSGNDIQPNSGKSSF